MRVAKKSRLPPFASSGVPTVIVSTDPVASHAPTLFTPMGEDSVSRFARAASEPAGGLPVGFVNTSVKVSPDDRPGTTGGGLVAAAYSSPGQHAVAPAVEPSGATHARHKLCADAFVRALYVPAGHGVHEAAVDCLTSA